MLRFEPIKYDNFMFDSMSEFSTKSTQILRTVECLKENYKPGTTELDQVVDKLLLEIKTVHQEVQAVALLCRSGVAEPALVG